MDSSSVLFSGLLVVLLLTSFVKMATVLSLLRHGLGLDGAAFGVAMLALSLALSMIVVGPQLKPFGGLQGIISVRPDPVAVEKQFRPFLEKHTEPKVSAKLIKISSQLNAEEAKKDTASAPDFSVVVAGFLISELKAALLVGLIILIPFFIIDLLVTNVLASLSVTQISAAVVSLPLKILLFFAIDGWALISEKLLLTYR